MKNDSRTTQLAETVVNKSIGVKPGDKVMITANNSPAHAFTRELIRAVYRAGGLPFLNWGDRILEREMLLGATAEQLRIDGENQAALMRQMDAFIGFTAVENSYELADVPAEKMKLYSDYIMDPVHHAIRVPHTRWIVLRWPTPGMAQGAEMSCAAFEDFYFDVCCLDYTRLSAAMDPLVELMEKTDQVRITGPGTDLTFSIRNIPVVKCDGGRNLPDGEVYTAPVKESLEGTLHYNCPAEYQGTRFDDVRFIFRKGKIVEATASHTRRLNEILDTDEGARFIGEFALGCNPKMNRPILNALFDEKITGSFHITPGNSYKKAPNGNHSAIHWDLVSIQTPAYGGGEIRFDDVLIRRDGLFTLPELQGLNPEAFA